MPDMQFPASKGTILVADDNPSIVNIVKTILEETGYGVRTADNGLEVISRLEEQKPDLIILDIIMPHMEGLEVLTRLKGIAETSSIPVIIITAKGQYGDMAESYILGADYYMPKPFTSTQMINGINYVVSGDQKHLPTQSYRMGRKGWQEGRASKKLFQT